MAVGLVALLGVPMAAADGARPGENGGPVVLGDDNNARAETSIVSKVAAKPGKGKGGYAMRESNISTGPSAGGGGIFGCRSERDSNAGGAACMRASNLSTGPALEANASRGPVISRFTTGDHRRLNASVSPLFTNATGVATNFNADKLDGKDAGDFLGKTATAADATKLAGRASSDFLTRGGDVVVVRAKLAFGETRTVASVGAISAEVACLEAYVPPPPDPLPAGYTPPAAIKRVVMLAKTTQPKAFMDGDSNKTGPGNGSGYLEPDTPFEQRQVADAMLSSGTDTEPGLEFDIDTAFIAGPKGEYLGIPETMAFGMNVFGADCYVAGVIDRIEAP